MYVAPDSNYCRVHANVLLRRNVVGVMGLVTYPADFLVYWCLGIGAGDKRWRHCTDHVHIPSLSFATVLLDLFCLSAIAMLVNAAPSLSVSSRTLPGQAQPTCQ